MLFNTYIETVIHFIEDSLINIKFKRTAFILKKFNTINVFAVTCNQFNASLLNTNINLFKKQSWLTANVWMEELLVMHGVYACFTQQKQHKAADVNGCYLELRRFCLILCSCNWRVLSSFTGLGINPTSHPSFTKRPIHQSLLYFCKQKMHKWKLSAYYLLNHASQRYSYHPYDMITYTSSFWISIYCWRITFHIRLHQHF